MAVLRRIAAIAAVALLAPVVALAADGLSYSGSSTIGQAILESAGAKRAFETKSGIKFTSFEVPGSGHGVEALIAGKVSVAGASRPLKAAEKSAGVLGTVIGYDAVAVFVNKDKPVNDRSKEQLKGIFTGKIKNWKEVGGKDAPIAVNTEIQGAKRATIEMFNEMVMDKAAYGAGFKEIDLPKDQIIEVARTPNAIGTPSFGLLAAVSTDVRAKVKAITVDGVGPTHADIQSGAYLISRPLNLCTMGPPKGDAKAFIEYMLSPEGQAFVAKDFVPVRKR
jgi:phosphate transport system substrate-binding protein